MQVEYLKPVPLNKPLTVTGYEQALRAGAHQRSGDQQ